MKKQSIILLLSLIYIVNGNYQNCQRYENKVYQLTVTYHNEKPFNVILELLPNYKFREISSIENGMNKAEIGGDSAFSDRIGYYKCLGKNEMRLTGLGYLYKSTSFDFLKDNGAVLLQDYYFSFTSDGQSCFGQVNYAIFKHGKNPFETNEKYITKGAGGKVTCERLSFRPYFYDLTPYNTDRSKFGF